MQTSGHVFLLSGRERPGALFSTALFDISSHAVNFMTPRLCCLELSICHFGVAWIGALLIIGLLILMCYKKHSRLVRMYM